MVGELPTAERDLEVEPKSRDLNYPLGLKLRSLQEESEEEIKPGVRVLEVTSNSPAFGQIFEGDIITKITFKNKTFDISNINDFIKTIESFDTGDIILIIGTRSGINIFEPVEIG